MSIPKGIVLLSGGLDSLLTIYVLREQNIDLTGLHFVLPFLCPDNDYEALSVKKFADSNGLKLIIEKCGTDYLDMVKNPPHGHGKNMNPCIDCKIFFLRRAAAIMRETGADFIATGEVLGQRPMSQRFDMIRHIERESGLLGKILRPLSATHFPPTDVERNGKIDRSKLLSLNGRGRKGQLELVEKYGISDYSSPAGGCLLTDRYFSNKIRDLFAHYNDITADDAFLLTVGRHVRIRDDLKLIIGRDEKENSVLEKHKSSYDAYSYPDFAGPSILAKGNITNDDIGLIVSTTAHYSKKGRNENDDIVNLYFKNSWTKHNATELLPNDFFKDKHI